MIVLSNLKDAGVDHIAHRVAELYMPVLKANAPKPIEDIAPDTTAFLRNVIDSVAHGEAKAEWFTQEWQAFFLPHRVKEGKSKLGTFGELSRFELMDESVMDGLQVRGYDAVFGTVTIRCQFKLTEDGKVAGIGLRQQ